MRTSKWMWAVLAVSAMAMAACGDDTGGGGGSDGSGGSAGEGGMGMGGMDAMQASTSTGSSTMSTGASTTSTGGGTAPAAPTLDEVGPLHGGLHLYWTNVAEDCDEVEGERMTPDEDFAVFFTVPGTIDNAADPDATDPVTEYTYRVRCRRGETYSEYSNELSASPE